MFVDIVIVLAAIFAILLIVPVRREVLIEGKFERSEDGWDFRGPVERPGIIFHFEHYCRACMDEWRKTGQQPMTVLRTCSQGVPTKRALALGSFRPKKGESTRLTVWKNVFGTVRAWKLEPSDFIWISPYDFKDQLAAETKGISVEEYKKVREQQYEEKRIAELMEKEGLTREEAELVEDLSILQIYDTEAKRCGITFFQASNAHRDHIKNMEPWPEICNEMVTWLGDAVTEYFAEHGVLPPDDDPKFMGVRRHLMECSRCASHMLADIWEDRNGETHEAALKRIGIPDPHQLFLQEGAREHGVTPEEYKRMRDEHWQLKFGSKDCCSLKERLTYARGKELTPERMAHAETCIGCKRMLAADRADFLATGKVGGLAAKAWNESRTASKVG